jgi:hypothetical protein
MISPRLALLCCCPQRALCFLDLRKPHPCQIRHCAPGLLLYFRGKQTILKGYHLCKPRLLTVARTPVRYAVSPLDCHCNSGVNKQY